MSTIDRFVERQGQTKQGIRQENVWPEGGASEEGLEAVMDRWDVVVDWKDIDGLIQGLDNALAKHGLELVVGNAEDDNFWLRIDQR